MVSTTSLSLAVLLVLLALAAVVLGITVAAVLLWRQGPRRW